MSRIVHLKDKEIALNFEELNELNLEEILVIDYSTLKEDLQTYPFVVNQIGLLLNEANNILRQENLQLDEMKNKLEEYKANKFIEVKKELIEGGEKSPTITLVESQIKLKRGYKELQEAIKAKISQINTATYERDNLNSLYWSSQSKMNLLVNLSKSIKVEEC